MSLGKTLWCLRWNTDCWLFSCILLCMQVSRFDMLPGIDVQWWGAAGDDVDSFLGGKVISDAKLSGPYTNASLQVILFTVEVISFFYNIG